MDGSGLPSGEIRFCSTMRATKLWSRSDLVQDSVAHQVAARVSDIRDQGELILVDQGRNQGGSHVVAHLLRVSLDAIVRCLEGLVEDVLEGLGGHLGDAREAIGRLSTDGFHRHSAGDLSGLVSTHTVRSHIETHVR